MAFLDALPLLRAALTHGEETSNHLSSCADEDVKYEVVEFDKVVFNHECMGDVFHDPQGPSLDNTNQQSIDTSRDAAEQSSDLKIKVLRPKQEPAEMTLHLEIITEDKTVSRQSSNDSGEGKSKGGSQSLITEIAAVDAQTKSTICPVCLKRFANVFSRRRHELIHSSTRPVQCQVCARTFRNEDEFLFHSRIHMVRRSFSCQFCPKAFRRSEDLWKHYSLSHAIEEGMSEVLEKTNLKNRMRKIPSRKSQQERPQSFSDDSNSRSCVSSRSTCRVCLKTLANPFSRRRHEVMHSEVFASRRPFRCQMCPRSFRRPISLRRHYWQAHRCDKLEKWRRSVLREKPYSYAFRDQRFRHFTSKLRHERFQRSSRRILEKRKEVDGTGAVDDA